MITPNPPDSISTPVNRTALLLLMLPIFNVAYIPEPVTAPGRSQAMCAGRHPSAIRTTPDDKTKSTSPCTQKTPSELLSRLQTKIKIEARRTPLREVIEQIGKGINTEFVIDSEALKSSGYTQIMPCHLPLAEITALEALDRILSRYRDQPEHLVLVADAEQKKLIITTNVEAEKTGLTPVDTKKKP
ncbi:MAG UNVERIFIED_CONTAM: hypothetical protein LVR18_02680 [Planctomycetaceae bacterium]